MRTIDSIFQDSKAKESAIKRMVKYTNKTEINECWEWQSTCNKRNYAMLSIGGRSGLYARASRIAYYLNFGPFNEDLLVCHSCDNPKCVNPNHLFLGTHKDNTNDMYRKGRESLPPTFYGENHSRSTLKEQEVIEIYNSSCEAKILASTYNVSKKTIYEIWKGTTWKHLNLQPKNLKPVVPTPKRRLTEEQVRYIRSSKKPNKTLANEFNYDASSVGKIKKFKLYQHVQ